MREQPAHQLDEHCHRIIRELLTKLDDLSHYQSVATAGVEIAGKPGRMLRCPPGSSAPTVQMTPAPAVPGGSPAAAEKLFARSTRRGSTQPALLAPNAANDSIRNVNSGHPGSITTVHANSAELAFEQLVLLVKESEGGAGLDRADIVAFLKASIDIVAQCRRHKGNFRLSEVYFRGERRAKE